MSAQPGLLILCGGIEAVAGIEVARRMGLRTIVVDGSPSAPGRALADRFVQASIYHPEEVIAALEPIWQELAVSGVVTVAADNSMTVARVGAHFGLPAQSVETARLATDKLAMKAALAEAGIPIPWYCAIDSLAALEGVLTGRPGNYVLKPIDSRGSRGVIRLSSVAECAVAYDYSREYTEAPRLILEEWLEGDQLSSESLVWHGQSHLCGLADRNYTRLADLYPYVVEDGGETPSRCYDDAMGGSADELMDRVCRAVGLTAGSIKGDLLLCQGRLVVIEFATRLSGGSFSTITIPLVHDYDLVGNVFRIALGQTPTLPDRPLRPRCYQANRFLFLPAGTVRRAEAPAGDLPHVVDRGLSVKVGDRLEGVKNHTMRGGWALACGASREEAIAAAQACLDAMHIEVEPADFSKAN
jgi:biotin carboxylase